MRILPRRREWKAHARTQTSGWVCLRFEFYTILYGTCVKFIQLFYFYFILFYFFVAFLKSTHAIQFYKLLLVMGVIVWRHRMKRSAAVIFSIHRWFYVPIYYWRIKSLNWPHNLNICCYGCHYSRHHCHCCCCRHHYCCCYIAKPLFIILFNINKVLLVDTNTKTWN